MDAITWDIFTKPPHWAKQWPVWDMKYCWRKNYGLHGILAK